MTDATNKLKFPAIIAITGASSGLGWALALYYARPNVTLLLQGRNEARLEAIASECRALGAKVEAARIDVMDQDAMSEWLISADSRMPIDLLIANAGISAGSGGGLLHGESAEQARKILGVNIDGVVNTIGPIIPRMSKRGSGQIALMASLAGYRGLPSAPAYSASKAAVRVYGEGLRGLLSARGVKVCVICPGYIRTPMTDRNPFRMPFIMSAERAASIIARGLRRNKARIAFPWMLSVPLWLITCLPPRWTDPFFARLPAKPSVH